MDLGREPEGADRLPRPRCVVGSAKRAAKRFRADPRPSVSEDFGTAEASFDAVQRLDPYRLDDIDDYSNMLFIFPKFTKLAQLAKEYSNIDRHRPETCTLIGDARLHACRAPLLGC